MIAARFTFSRGFHNGRARVEIGKSHGFIDPEGNMVIPPQFISVEDFEDGLSYVETEDSVGYIDPAGELVWRGPYVAARWDSSR